jgi:hypothetical protein
VETLADAKSHTALKIPCVYDYITKLCRTQAEGILNRRNPIVRGIGQGEAMRKKYSISGINLAAVMRKTVELTNSVSELLN